MLSPLSSGRSFAKIGVFTASHMRPVVPTRLSSESHGGHAVPRLCGGEALVLELLDKALA